MRKIILLVLTIILTSKVYASSGDNNDHPIRGIFTDCYGRRYGVLPQNNERENFVLSSICQEISGMFLSLPYYRPLPSNFPRSIILENLGQNINIEGSSGFSSGTSRILDYGIRASIFNRNPQYRSPIFVSIHRINSRNSLLEILLLRGRNSEIIRPDEASRAIEEIINYLNEYGRHDIIDNYPEYFRIGENGHNGANNRATTIGITNILNNMLTIVTNLANEDTEGEEETEANTEENSNISNLFFRLLFGGNGSL